MSRKIKGLDGLRGVSVLMVIMSHAVIWPRIGVDSPGIIAIFSAQSGVNAFFALSGFLITLLLIEERVATGTTDIRSFFMRRTLRIFPLYFLAVTLLLLVDMLGMAKINNCAFYFAYTYTQNFSTSSCSFSSMSHLWSLAVEEHFYLVWPLIFLIGTRFAFLASVAFAVACLVVGPYIILSFPESKVMRWTFPAAAPIAFGCVAAFICNNKKIVDLFGSSKNSSVMLIAILAGLASPAFYRSDLIWMISISSLILYVFHNQNSRLVKILEFRPLALLGLISYGLYVWQGFFTGNGPYRMGEQFPPAMDTGLWLTFIVAPVSYLFFEKPIMKLKSRFSWRGTQRKAVPQAMDIIVEKNQARIFP